MTDQSTNQPIEKQVEEAIKVCAKQIGLAIEHGPIWQQDVEHLISAHVRPAVLALLERRGNAHVAELEIKRKSFEAIAASEFELRRRVVDLERREQEHAAEVLQLEQDHDAKLAEWHSRWQAASTCHLIGCPICKPPELGPCPRHGKEFLRKDHHHCCQAIESNDTEPCDCNAPWLCTACAQERPHNR